MYRILITILLACCALGAMAQTNNDSSVRNVTNLSLGVEPLFGFNNCIKFSLEAKPQHSSFGLELTPEFYVGDHIFNYNEDQVAGFGIGLYLKKYFGHSQRHPMSLNFGATYRNINVSYSDVGFIPFQQDGLAYYRYEQFDDVLKARNLLVNFSYSAKVVNTRVFFLEPYAGFGYKFGSTSATYPGYRSENKGMLDYGYRGFTWTLGFKLGVNLKSRR